jgi:hypothetical protein
MKPAFLMDTGFNPGAARGTAARIAGASEPIRVMMSREITAAPRAS